MKKDLDEMSREELLQELKRIRTQGMVVYAELNPRDRHAEPLYFSMFEEDEVNDGLEHIKDDPAFTRCRLIPEPL